MASLRNNPISINLCSNFSPSTQQSKSPFTVSFSSTFPSLKIATHNRGRSSGGSAAGARMSATAASSYATAILDVAKGNNSLEATCADMEKLEKMFSEPGVLGFFSNPIIDLEKKRQVVDEIAESSALQPYMANFLNILIEAKRVDLVADIVREFEALYNRLTETELAVVSSVVKLESQHLAQIAKQVQKLTGAKNVRIKTSLEPSLVAGFTVRYGPSGSKLIDMSVKKQLEEIAAQLDVGDIQLAV
ncbi:unnamed protein product [Linum tenue]|uniref:Uncharacterized protein n=3 Tax=Linum tenue TaxID=586396 RepID=A0AAV0MPM5_9ROSI|nr:unnamed protein product [Linum tenue]